MKRPSRAHGFTLIEILVVLVIIGIVSVGVTYTVGSNPRKQAHYFVEQVMDTFHLLQRYAILTQSIVGVNVLEHQLEFFVYLPDSKEPSSGKWQAISSEVVQPVLVFPAGVRLSLQIAGRDHVIESEDARSIPEIVLGMNGRMTPFDLAFILDNGHIVERIRGQISGQLDGQSEE